MQHIVGNNITTINKSHLRFVWKRLNKPDVKIKMTESKALWRQINYDLDLVIYCPGWTTNFTKYEPVTVQLFAADFLNRGDVNFVVWKINIIYKLSKTRLNGCSFFPPFLGGRSRFVLMRFHIHHFKKKYNVIRNVLFM